MNEIFKLVCSYEDGTEEIFPRIFFDKEKAIERATEMRQKDEACTGVRIYTEVADTELGSFVTKSWKDF